MVKKKRSGLPKEEGYLGTIVLMILLCDIVQKISAILYKI